MNKSKNAWILVSAILSTLAIVLFAILIIACFVSRSEVSNYINFDPAQIAYYQDLYLGLGLYSIFALAMTIFNTVVFFKYVHYSYDEIKKSLGLPITAIVFSFLCGCLFSAIFAIVGITVNSDEKEEEDKDSNKSLDAELDKLISLKNKGMISQEQFDSLKKHSIDKYLKS